MLDVKYKYSDYHVLDDHLIQYGSCVKSTKMQVIYVQSYHNSLTTIEEWGWLRSLYGFQVQVSTC